MNLRRNLTMNSSSPDYKIKIHQPKNTWLIYLCNHQGRKRHGMYAVGSPYGP